jgi:hypothetical protein
MAPKTCVREGGREGQGAAGASAVCEVEGEAVGGSAHALVMLLQLVVCHTGA